MCHKVALRESPAEVPARSGLSKKDVRPFAISAAKFAAQYKREMQTRTRGAIIRPCGAAICASFRNKTSYPKGVNAGQVRLQVLLESGSLVQCHRTIKKGYRPHSRFSQGVAKAPCVRKHGVALRYKAQAVIAAFLCKGGSCVPAQEPFFIVET